MDGGLSEGDCPQSSWSRLVLSSRAMLQARALGRPIRTVDRIANRIQDNLTSL